MKRLLSILGMTMLTASSVIPVISCAQPKQKQLTIHVQIKKSLQNTITFNDDWITDYSQPEDKIEKWTKTFQVSSWNFFNKLITNLVIQQLLKDIPTLMECYPDFSLSASFILNDGTNIKNSIKNNQKIIFNYYVSYNLQQLQNIPFQELLDNNNLLPSDKNAIIKFYDGSVFGQYKIMGKGSQNKILFNQNNFIIDDKKRLNYLAKMLNDTTTIRAFDGSYRKFLMMNKYISSVKFKKTDFSMEELVKKIHEDNNIFNRIIIFLILKKKIY